MSELRIRPAETGELDIVASLTVDAYAEYAARMSPDAWSAFAQEIANVRGRAMDAEVVVAERGDRLVGSVTRYPNWRGAQADTAALRLLAVPPAERNVGVGTALMRYCIEVSRDEGKRRVVLTATPEMTSVRDLLRSLEFIREHSLDHMPAPGVHAQGYALTL